MAAMDMEPETGGDFNHDIQVVISLLMSDAEVIIIKGGYLF